MAYVAKNCTIAEQAMRPAKMTRTELFLVAAERMPVTQRRMLTAPTQIMRLGKMESQEEMKESLVIW